MILLKTQYSPIVLKSSKCVLSALNIYTKLSWTYHRLEKLSCFCDNCRSMVHNVYKISLLPCKAYFSTCNVCNNIYLLTVNLSMLNETYMSWEILAKCCFYDYGLDICGPRSFSYRLWQTKPLIQCHARNMRCTHIHIKAPSIALNCLWKQDIEQKWWHQE